MPRASLAATPVEAGAAKHEPHLLVEAGGRRYALALAPVREIVTARPATRLPGAPPFVRGLVNLRGRIVTVVDLPRALGPDAAVPEHRIIVVEHRGKRVGVAVDDVVRIVALDPSSLTPGDPAEGRPVVAGTAEADGETFGVIDPDALLRPVLA